MSSRVMIPRYVEYVSEDSVIADIALRESTSASLRTSNAILLAVLILASYILNMILLCTVYTSRKLRTSLIYLMFTYMCLINILDLSFSVLLSLVYIANGTWIFGTLWCRINATVQEFCQLYMLLTIALMAVERAIGLVTDSASLPNQRVGDHLQTLTRKRIIILSIVLALASFAISVPTVTGALPVKPFKNRYVCAITSGAPLGYSLCRLFIYTGCLCVLLVCASAVFKKREGHSLPQQAHEYSDFIRRNRAMQEHLSRAKLVALLVCIFIAVEGPYISLCFAFEIVNSYDVTSDGLVLDIPQDADTLITWLKFLFPLLSPIAILCWCSDISGYLKELFCCRSYDPPVIGQIGTGYKGVGAMPGVMTLVATPEGLQLKLPSSVASPPDPIRLPQPCPDPQPYEGPPSASNNVEAGAPDVDDGNVVAAAAAAAAEFNNSPDSGPLPIKKELNPVKKRKAGPSNAKPKAGATRTQGGKQRRVNVAK